MLSSFQVQLARACQSRRQCKSFTWIWLSQRALSPTRLMPFLQHKMQNCRAAQSHAACRHHIQQSGNLQQLRLSNRMQNLSSAQRHSVRGPSATRTTRLAWTRLTNKLQAGILGLWRPTAQECLVISSSVSVLSLPVSRMVCRPQIMQTIPLHAKNPTRSGQCMTANTCRRDEYTHWCACVTPRLLDVCGI
jgi:hypothetical protein